MPSLFPGMDPWLETRDVWRGFHNTMITYMMSALNASLPDGVRAFTDVRLYVVEPARDILPDVTIVETRKLGHDIRRPATVLDVDEPKIIEVPSLAEREAFIEIRLTSRPNRILTVIELLGPSNKVMGSVGFREYRRKQQEVLDSDINLLEIDLLRGGSHSVAVPQSPLEERTGWDYLVCLHRATRPFFYEYWPVSLRNRLPRIRVPLNSDREDASLDLQTAFDTAYDNGAYKDFLDYDREPDPPLTDEDAIWADALLRDSRRGS